MVAQGRPLQQRHPGVAGGIFAGRRRGVSFHAPGHHQWELETALPLQISRKEKANVYLLDSFALSISVTVGAVNDAYS